MTRKDLQHDAEARSDELLQRYFDKTLTRGEAMELIDFWDQSKDLEGRAGDHYDIHHLLKFLDRQEKEHLLVKAISQTSLEIQRDSDWDDVARQAAIDSEKKTTWNSLNHSIYWAFKPSTQREIVRNWICLGCVLFLFASVIYMEFYYSRSPKPSSFAPLAKVTASVDVVWPEGAEIYKTGQELDAERIHFEKGLLELTLRSGVRIALEGPVDVQLNSASQMFCGQGKLSATVPPSGKGFEVSTQFLTVVDLGTEFFLNVEKDKAETHTILGSVELKRLPQNKELLLAGKAFEIRSGGKFRRGNANPALFVSQEKVVKQVDETDRRDIENWRNASMEVETDPSLLVYFDFEERGRIVSNRSKTGRTIVAEGRLTGTRPTQGRWRNKNAVQFSRKNDAVEFHVPRELRSMTFSISARIDAVNRPSHVLLASRDIGAGHVVWQICQDGSLQLTIQKEAERSTKRFSTPPVFSRKKWGGWYKIDTVVDAENNVVKHYVDGLPIAEIPMEEDYPIMIEDATIGNGFWKGKAASDRSFEGAIDQLMIFDRALSDEEIRHLHLSDNKDL